jgi:hypothetical protein
MPSRYSPLTAFEVSNERATERPTHKQPTGKETEVTSQELGESRGREFDELPMSSVVYVGRGSFRMEAIALAPVLEPELGVVQPMVGAATAPLHATAVPEHDEARQAPGLRPLFGSQVDVPVLVAPTGSAALRVPVVNVVTLSRAMLATLGGLVLVCGIVVGTAARHLLASPAPLAVVAAPAMATPVAAAALVEPPSAPVADTAPPSPPPLVAVPAPVTIRARDKPVAKVAAARVARAATGRPQAKRWVDPWAE